MSSYSNNQISNRTVHTIFWIEILSYFLQYTFGLSRSMGAVFDFITTSLSLLCLLNFKFNDYSDKWKKKVIACIAVVLVFSSVYNIDMFGLGSIMTIGRYLMYSLLISKMYIDIHLRKALLYLLILQLFLLQYVDLSSYNTNTQGLIYLFIGVFITLLFPKSKKKMFLFGLAIFAFIEWKIYLTDTRTCFIAYFLFFIGCYFPFNLLRSKLFLISVLLVLTLGSLVYARTYVYLWEENLVDTEVVASTAEETGKDLFSGRQKIWQECFELLEKHPLTGTGSKIKLQSFHVVNLHNSMLNVFVIYGGIIGLLFVYLVVRSAYELHPALNIRKARECMYAFLIFLIIGINETNLFVFAFLSQLPLMIANSEKLNYQSKNQ